MNASVLRRITRWGILMIGLVAGVTTALAGTPGGRGDATAPSSPPLPTPPLSFTLNARGLATLSYNGISLLRRDQPSGQFAPDYYTSPTFQRGDGTSYISKALATAQRLEGNTVTVTFPWGVCTCCYTQDGAQVNMDVTVKNTSPDTMSTFDLRSVANVSFPATPQCWTGNPGMFYANCGPTKLGSYPIWCAPCVCAPILHLDYGSGVMDFTNENVTSRIAVGVPYAEDGAPARLFSLMAHFVPSATPLPSGGAASTRLAMRFNAAGTDWTVSAGDLLQRYYAAYPRVFVCNDHRPIGADMIGGPGPHSVKNPRGYFDNDPTIDVTTDAGLLNFRHRMLARAADIVAVLKKINAQGIITWDIEGEEVADCEYYGDPSWVTKVPEMMYQVDGVATVDAYYQYIKAAGFRIGNGLRTQHLTYDANHKLCQYDIADPAQDMVRKAQFAIKRWGSTLFYCDSTVFTDTPHGNTYGAMQDPDSNGSIKADYWQTVQQACPQAVFFPENQDGRYYAYTAPLDSYMHHGVTGTPQPVRDQWPGACTLLLFNGIRQQADVPALVRSVKAGDILISNCWFDNPANDDTNRIYQLAGALPAVQLTAPADGTSKKARGHLTITAMASSPISDPVQQVIFYLSSTTAPRKILGTATHAPYTCKWRHLPPGRYVISSCVTTASGRMQYSNGVNITVASTAARRHTPR